MTYLNDISDPVWKALADSRRRVILEMLSEGPKLTGDLVARFPDMGRTAVLKHIDVLEDAELITLKRDGRKRWNYINPHPILEICQGWVKTHIQGLESSALDLKSLAESERE